MHPICTAVASLAFSALTFVASAFAQTQLEIHYINVGWGGSVLVKGPDGTTVLMEAGDTGKGTSAVVPYLQSIGLTPAMGLDYTIAGHQHCDHIGGLDEVINAGYNVRFANYYNGSTHTSTCVTGWNTAAATTTAGAPIAMPVGQQIFLGNGAILTCIARNGSIIGGGTVSVSDENDRSIAVLIQYGGFDYLWASDLGGGSDTCTGRSTSQTNVESAVIQAISPGGAAPMISAGGIDVLHVNHHGSESSTNPDWFNLSQPAVAVMGVGAGQTSTFQLPRIDVVEHVLLAQSTACVTAPGTLALQSEEGSPSGSLTSFAGYCVGDIKISTDGVNSFLVDADGHVTEGAVEVVAAGLPRLFSLDDVSGPPDTTPPVISNVTATNIGSTSATITWTTDEASDSVVEYGLTTSYGSTASNATRVTSHSIALMGLTSNAVYNYRVKSADAAGNTATSANFSFQTGSTSFYTPVSTTILQGSLSSGTFSNLATNNASYYVVNSTTSGTTRFTDWYATFTVSQASASVSALTVTYDGKFSRSSRTQTLHLFDWTTSAWVQINSRTVGTSDVTTTQAATLPSRFVSATGTVRLRVLGQGGSSQSFTCSGDWARVQIDTAGGNL
ncbi:MAG: fibronectin type III domain-containing protein [Planctomycetes bacterium]|nr:fibronectin type III domain-containing protein [Planctomycetota bacterium]MBI3843172.1 fibronectin type III domain-containing protein [Planctomycetota bacterium]